MNEKNVAEMPKSILFLMIRRSRQNNDHILICCNSQDFGAGLATLKMSSVVLSAGAPSWKWVPEHE